MQKKAVGVLGFLLFLTCLALPLTAGQDPAVFIFGGKNFTLGCRNMTRQQHSRAAANFLHRQNQRLRNSPRPATVVTSFFRLKTHHKSSEAFSFPMARLCGSLVQLLRISIAGTKTWWDSPE